MNLATYQRAAERTMTDTDNTMRMVNAALGLCGETAELSQLVGGVTPILDEAGDLLWYVAQLCKAIGWSIADIPPENITMGEATALYDLLQHTGRIADMVKKHVFHQRPLPLTDLARHLRAIVTDVTILLGALDYTIEHACEYNVAKLLKRYPNGYSHSDAARRADEEHADAR